MGVIFVRLKKGELVAPKYEKIIYPDSNGNWTKIDEKYLELVKKDPRIEIKTQEEMKEVTEDRKQLINDIIDGQWKQSEKRINSISDIKFLEYDLLPALIEKNKEKNREKLIQITKDKIEELKPQK
jgi:hypothetical protein